MPAPKTVMVLGPFLDGVIEPFPDASVAVPAVAGQRQISFRTPATTPGGIVNLQILPPVTPQDIIPLNIYAFFVTPVASVPAPADRTPGWFFKSGAPNGSIHAGSADPTTGAFQVVVAGVKPSLDPYFVQTVLEFPVS